MKAEETGNLQDELNKSLCLIKINLHIPQSLIRGKIDRINSLIDSLVEEYSNVDIKITDKYVLPVLPFVI